MIKVGTGWLNWCRAERQVGRYGTVRLFTKQSGPLNSQEESEDAPLDRSLNGKRGGFVAEVLEVGQSHLHFDGHASCGDRVTLGGGVVFYEAGEEIDGIGLHPEVVTMPHLFIMSAASEVYTTVENTFPWLDMKALFSVHNCRVVLYFDQS